MEEGISPLKEKFIRGQLGLLAQDALLKYLEVQDEQTSPQDMTIQEFLDLLFI